MRLTELAAEIGITPADAWVILANHAALGWQPSSNNLYALKIPPEFVERVREILLGASAENVRQFITEKHGGEPQDDAPESTDRKSVV